MLTRGVTSKTSACDETGMWTARTSACQRMYISARSTFCIELHIIITWVLLASSLEMSAQVIPCCVGLMEIKYYHHIGLDDKELPDA